MRAIVIDHYGPPEVLTQCELPDPVAEDGDVLVRVHAFGLNHAECYFRSEADSSGTFAPGTAVVAVLGGMGRTRNGSYAELVAVPASNVARVDVDLPWPVLAAVPEVYATAWSALHRNLDLASGQRLLVRGATSALGQAVLQLGALTGAEIVATTRRADRAGFLRELGAHHVLIDDGLLADQLADSIGPTDALVDLVGNAVLRDSLRCLRPGGRIVLLGFLGGLEPLDAFNPLADLPTGVQLSFYASAFVLGSEEYPLTEVPLNDIFDDVAAGELRAGPVRAFDAADIVEAHRLMEAGTAGGKLVAVWPSDT